MKNEIITLILFFNAIVIYIFIPNDGFGYTLIASFFISFVLFPITALEYLLLEIIIGFFDKKNKITHP